MPRGTKLMLSFADWPTEDQGRWERAFKTADRFDESGPGAHLAPATRKGRRESYGRFLAFISAVHPDRLATQPEARIDRSTVAEYVEWRKKMSGDTTIYVDLDALRGALKLICPDTDLSWLLTVNKRIVAMAPPKAGKFHLVTS